MRRLVSMMAVLSPLLVPVSALAQDTPRNDAQLGGPGESCRATADCRTGLKCIAASCVDEREGQACSATADCGGLKCIDQKCTSSAKKKKKKAKHDDGYNDSSSRSSDDDDDRDNGDWMSFALEGIHPFVGIGLYGGPALPFSATTGKPGSMAASGLFSLRGGIYAGRNEFAIELSPMTYAAVTSVNTGPQFQLAFNYTGLIPLMEGSPLSLYWPMRVGVGFVTANLANTSLLQLRFDLIGLAFKIGHLMIDVSLPSFRHLYAPGDQNGNFMVFTWHIGAQVSYIF